MRGHQTFPAGWYQDPQRSDFERYWDAVRWTDQIKPIEPSTTGDRWNATFGPDVTQADNLSSTARPSVLSANSIVKNAVNSEVPGKTLATKTPDSDSSSRAQTANLPTITAKAQQQPQVLYKPRGFYPTRPERRFYWETKRFLVPAAGVAALCFLILGAVLGSASTTASPPDDSGPQALALSASAAAHVESLSYEFDVSGSVTRPSWSTTFRVSAPLGYWQPQTITGQACEITNESALKLSNEFGAPLVFRLSGDNVADAMTAFSRTSSSIVDGRCEVTVVALGSVEELTEVIVFGSDELFVEFDGKDFFSGQIGAPRLGNLMARETMQELKSAPPAGAEISPDTATTQPATNAAEPAAGVEALPSPVSYPNCAAARAAGKAPIYSGEPGYRSALDGDDDGIACEKRTATSEPASP